MTEDEYIKKMCDKKYDISQIINDYILKVYYCVRQKAQNEKIDYSELYEALNENDINKEREYVKKEELLDRNTFLNNDPFDYKMNVKTLSFDEMECMYNNITDGDIENFNNGSFIKNFLSEIEQKIKYTKANEYINKDKLLSRYLVSKIYVRSLCKNFLKMRY